MFPPDRIHTTFLPLISVFKGLKYYFLIEFYQKPGELKKIVNKALGVNDDIVRFEYIKKTSNERGVALVGIELKYKGDINSLICRMDNMVLPVGK